MQPRKRRGGRPGARRSKPWFVQYRLPNGRQKSPGFATYDQALTFCDALEAERAGLSVVADGQLITERRVFIQALHELMNEDRAALEAILKRVEQLLRALERHVAQLTAER